jgi:amino acid transporter
MTRCLALDLDRVRNSAQREWDSCLAVTEEINDADKTPGRAALLSTVILLFTYLIVAVAIQAFAGSATPASGGPTRKTPMTC